MEKKEEGGKVEGGNKRTEREEKPGGKGLVA